MIYFVHTEEGLALNLAYVKRIEWLEDGSMALTDDMGGRYTARGTMRAQIESAMRICNEFTTRAWSVKERGKLD